MRDSLMSQQRIPPEAQKLLSEYQALQNNYVKIDAELRLIETELAEIDNILDTLKTVKEETEIYKLVGHIMVKKSRDDVVKELEERKELLSIKKEKYKNQLSLLEKKLKELNEQIKSILERHGIAVG
jgi:prefoldin beta subunit